MNISELIEDLQNALKEYGDLEVEIMYDFEGEVVENVTTTAIGQYTLKNKTITTFTICGNVQ